MISAIVADDHPAFTLGLELMMRDNGIDVVAVVHDGRALVEAVASQGPDVVLTDVRMPLMSGIEACHALRAAGRSAAVIILSTFDDAATVQAARAAGARAYLRKDVAIEDLVRIIRAVAADPEASYIEAPLLPHLTPREIDVLTALSMGLTNKQIAQRLDIGTETVKDHCSSIFAKLNVVDRLGALIEARRLGLPG